MGKKIQTSELKKNGVVSVLFHSINGVYQFDNQLYTRLDGSRTSFLEENGGVCGGRYSAELDKRICHWANVLSYTKQSDLLVETTGKRQLSSHGLKSYILQRAASISQNWVNESAASKVASEVAGNILIIKDINIYSATDSEVIIQMDDVGVKAQKPHKKQERVKGDAKRIDTTIVLVSDEKGRYHTLTEGIDACGTIIYPIEDAIRTKIRKLYPQKKPLAVVAITDGARSIRISLQSIFGLSLCIILDWYHLAHKIGELMSMIATNKEEKEMIITDLKRFLWRGDVATALETLTNMKAIKNAEKHQELIDYLTKHQHEIIDYEKRQKAGKNIGAGRCEKQNDLIVANRQKKKGMAWSKKGSKALAIVNVFLRNQKDAA